MIKTSIIALLAVAAMGSVAAPAFADDNNDNGHDRSSYSYGSYLDVSNLLSRLHEQGINATAVEPWGSLVRANVIDENGRQVSQLFDRDTLKPAAL